MALAAVGIFIPQLLFVPLLQAAMNRRTEARIRVLRQLGIAMIDRADGAEHDYRIQRRFRSTWGFLK
jgi:hypothetical protein